MRTRGRRGLTLGLGALVAAASWAAPRSSAGVDLYRSAGEAWRAEHAEDAERLLYECLELARTDGDHRLEERAQVAMDKVRAHLEETLTTAQARVRLEAGDPARVAASLGALARTGAAGDAEAARILGVLHVEGHLVEADLSRGLAWIDAAIAAGDTPSMLYKAELAERGLGMPLDLPFARELYRKAAEAGDGEGAYRLGKALLERGRAEDAERWLRQAAEGGLVAAQVDLGTLLFEGGARDEEAVDWFHRAHRAGDAEGTFDLGLCVLLGRGMVQDRELALEYFHQAAAGGSRAAREALETLRESEVVESHSD